MRKRCNGGGRRDAKVWVPAARKKGGEGGGRDGQGGRAGDGGGGYVPTRPQSPSAQVGAGTHRQAGEVAAKSREGGHRPSSVPCSRQVPKLRLLSAPPRGRSTPQVETALSETTLSGDEGQVPAERRAGVSASGSSPASPASFEIYTDDGEEDGEEDDEGVGWPVEGRKLHSGFRVEGADLRSDDMRASGGKGGGDDEGEGEVSALVADMEKDSEDEKEGALQTAAVTPADRAGSAAASVSSGSHDTSHRGRGVSASRRRARTLLRYVVSCSVYVGRAPATPIQHACSADELRMCIYSVSSGTDFTAEREHLDQVVYPALKYMLRRRCEVTWGFHEWDGEVLEPGAAHQRLQALEESYLGCTRDTLAAANVCIALIGSRPTALVSPNSTAALGCLDKGFLWYFDPGKLPNGPALPVARLELELVSGKHSGKHRILLLARRLLSLLEDAGIYGCEGASREQDSLLGSRTGEVVGLLRSLVAGRGSADHGGTRDDGGRRAYCRGKSSEHGWTWSDKLGVGAPGAHGCTQALPVERIAAVSSRLAEVLPMVTQELLSGTNDQAGESDRAAAGCVPGGAAAAAALVSGLGSSPEGVAIAGMPQMRRQRMDKIRQISDVLAKLAGSDGEDLREEVDALEKGMIGASRPDEVLAQADNVLYCLDSLCDADLIPAQANTAVRYTRPPSQGHVFPFPIYPTASSPEASMRACLRRLRRLMEVGH